MELETINKLFLELSQITTAFTKRELDLYHALKDEIDDCSSQEAKALVHFFDMRNHDAADWYDNRNR